MRHRLAAFVFLASCGLGVATAQTAIDGTWKSSHKAPERVTFKTMPGAVTMSSSTGTGYTARLDGAHAPLTGEKEAHTVSVRMPAPNVLEETTYKGRKPFVHFTLEVAPDGKTAKVTWKSLTTGKSGGYSMTRE